MTSAVMLRRDGGTARSLVGGCFERPDRLARPRPPCGEKYHSLEPMLSLVGWYDYL